MSKSRKIFHLSHKNNFNSIIKEGLLSNAELARRNIKYKDISYHSVQLKRNKMLSINEEEYHLYRFIPFFYREITPMLWAKKNELPNLFLIELSLEKVLANKNITYCFTDGNAAKYETEFFLDWQKYSHRIPWKLIEKPGAWWESQRSAVSSEFLILNKVDISLIERVIVMLPSESNFYRQKLKEFNLEKSINVEVKRGAFPS